MAARIEEQRERRESPRSTTPTRTSTTTAPEQRGDSEVHEVSLTQLRAKFPGLISMGQGG
jgi:hypothetical protein